MAGATGVAAPNAVVVKNASGAVADSTIYAGMTTASDGLKCSPKA